MRLVSLLLFNCFFLSCKAQKPAADLLINKDDNSLLWQINGKGLQSPSYLFGTFHILCKSDIQFSEQLKIAFGNAKEIYLEMDMDDPAMLMGAMTLMNMKGGKQLKDLFSEAEYLRLSSFFKDSLQMPLTMFQGMKPMFLEALLYPKMMPCKTASGVEEELMKLARQQKKTISGLETMAFQASVFDSIPYKEQAAGLLKTIDSIELYKKYFDSMVTIYKSQQLDEMQHLINNSEMGMQEHQEILLDNRNKNWVNQLNGIFKNKSVFVAVGAGHLIGENGLISLLRKEGYTVQPLFNK